MLQENKALQIFRKTNISYPLHTCAYQGVRNVCFSENLVCFVFLKHPFWDSPFCLITNELWKHFNVALTLMTFSIVQTQKNEAKQIKKRIVIVLDLRSTSGIATSHSAQLKASLKFLTLQPQPWWLRNYCEVKSVWRNYVGMRFLKKQPPEVFCKKRCS